MVPRTVKTQQFGVLLSLSLDSVGVRSNLKMFENMHLLQKGEGKEFCKKSCNSINGPNDENSHG